MERFAGTLLEAPLQYFFVQVISQASAWLLFFGIIGCFIEWVSWLEYDDFCWQKKRES
jgi:hypothetical protein